MSVHIRWCRGIGWNEDCKLLIAYGRSEMVIYIVKVKRTCSTTWYRGIPCFQYGLSSDSTPLTSNYKIWVENQKSLYRYLKKDTGETGSIVNNREDYTLVETNVMKLLCRPTCTEIRFASVSKTAQNVFVRAMCGDKLWCGSQWREYIWYCLRNSLKRFVLIRKKIRHYNKL